MQDFAYIAATADDRNQRGVITAETLDAAAEELIARGLVPIRIKEAANFEGNARSDRSMSPADLAELLDQTRTYLDAGLPVDRANALVAKAAQSKSVKRIATAVYASLRDGSTYADSLEQAAPDIAPYIPVLIRAGEASGQVSQVLARIVMQLQRRKAFGSAVVSALLYPAFILATALGAVVLISTVLVPQLQDLFAGSDKERPFAVSVLLTLNELLEAGAIPAAVLAVGCLGIGVTRRKYANSRRERAVATVANLFGGLARKYDVAHFARLMGTLIENGVGIDQAVGLASGAVRDPRMSGDLENIRNEIRAGSRLSNALASKVWCPPLVSELVSVGEEASQLPAMLIKSADALDAEVESSILRLKTLLAPALTLIVGIFVGLIVYLLLSALLSLNDLAGLS